MSKTSVRIGAFEIDDAELHGEQQGERTLSIPCKSDPDLCMQLDAWDADTSVPAILDGEHSVLYRKHYDRQSDAWIMRLARFKGTRRLRRVIYSPCFPDISYTYNYVFQDMRPGCLP